MEIIRHCFMTTALSFSSGASEIQLGSPGKCRGHPRAVGEPAQINELEMSENYKWDAPECRANVQTSIQTLIINHGDVWLRVIAFFLFRRRKKKEKNRENESTTFRRNGGLGLHDETYVLLSLVETFSAVNFVKMSNSHFERAEIDSK